MATLEITLRMKVGESWPVVAEFSGPEGGLPERCEGALALDLTQLAGLAHEPKLYGDALGQALFQGPLHEAFGEALARSAAHPLRLLLYVEDRELQSLRWERLCALVDQSWVQLASYQRVLLSRYQPSLTDRRFPPIGRGDLRALIVVASPPGLSDYGLAHFDETAAVREVISALGEVPHTLLATSVAGASGPPTLSQICTRITGEGPTLLHIVAHGRAFDNENLLYLCADDDANTVDPVSTSRLRDQLARLNSVHGLPHLIFLSTCESASPTVNGTLGSLGQRLVIELGVPAVVAMADLVTVETANALAGSFYRLLISGREVDRALVGATAGLAERGDSTVPVLYSRLADRPLFDETVKRELTAEEIERGLTKLAELLDKRAPVLSSDCAAAADSLRRSAATAHGALSEEARADQQQARATIDALCSETAELSFAALASGATPPHYDGHICPFPGLNAFSDSPHDQRFFFGREELVAELLALIEQRPCLTVVGPGSSGKSSLVLAGLLPKLRAATPGLGLARFSPGELPLAALERELYLQAQAGASQLLVMIDRFEELFTICTSDEERQHFVERLLSLPQAHLTVILLRPEFLDACKKLPALDSLISSNLKPIEPLSAEALREVIERQAAAVGLRFEAGLTSTILNEVRGQRVRMPLAQHALRELWARRRGRWLRAKAYEDLGGVRRALATSADTIYHSSLPADKARLRTIFVRLTRIDRAGSGADRRDTRQRIAVADLVPADDTPDTIRSLVDKLEAKSLIIRDQSDANDSIEFADDVLIQAWPQLQTWLNEDRETLTQLSDLQQQAQRWHERGRDPSFLLRDTQIADATPLTRQRRYALNSLERAYIDASLATQEEARQKELAQLKALAKAEESKAKKQKQLTEKQRQLAHEQQRSAELAQQSADRFRQLAIGMAGVAVVAIVAMIVAAVLGGVAQSNAQQAQQAAATADVAKNEAETQQELALAARNQAQTAEALAVAEQGRADSAAAEALNRALAAEAQAALDRGDPGQAIALALQALERDRDLNGAALTLAAAADQAARLQLVGHEASIFAVAYSPDGRSAVSGDTAGVIIFWDLERGRETLRFQEHTNHINALIYSPDGQTAFSASDDNTVRAWGLGGGRIIIQHSSEANALAISPAGDLLVVGYGSGEIILYGSANGQQIRRLSGPSDTAAWSLAYSPDGSQIASGARDGSIALWRVADGELLGSFGDHTEQINSLAFSPDGLAILSASEDTTVSSWDLATGLKRFGVSHDGGAIYAAYSPDGRSVVSSSFDQSVTLWDVESSSSLRSFTGHTSEVNGLAFSADGRKLLTGSFDHDLRLWDIAPRRLVRAIPQASGGDLLRSMAISDNGKLAAVGSSSGRVTIWNLERGEQVRTLSSPQLTDAVIQMLLTDEVLVAASSQVVRGWVLSDGTAINELSIELDADVVALDFSDENLTLAALRESAEAFVENPSGERVLFVGHSDYVTSVALSPDASQVLTGSFDRTMRLWDTASGQIIRVFIGHKRGIRDVTFSPSGTQAISVSEDRTMRLWDLASGRELARFTTNGGQLSSVALDASGTRAISGSEKDGTLLVWQIETLDELIASVRASRSIPELSCELRARYALTPLCAATAADRSPGAQP